MSEWGEIIAKFVIAFALMMLNGFIIWLCWNGTLVFVIDGLHEITYWQGIGIGILSGELFKSSDIKTKKD